MIDVAKKAVNIALNLGAEYADARTGKSLSTSIRAVNGKFDRITSGIDAGIGLRVIFNGALGFASSILGKDLKEAAIKALKAARATSEGVKEKVVFAPVETYKDKVSTEAKEDLAEVELKRKMRLLLLANQTAEAVSPKVTSIDSLYRDDVSESTIVTSEGTELYERSSFGVFRILVFAKEGDKIRMCGEIIGAAGGFEVFDEDEIEKKTEEAAKRAVAMLDAEPAPSGRYTVIADPELAGTFAHEATGHACEGDAVIAGESILKDRLGQQIGSEQVSIYDDSTLPKSWGSAKYDDEGVRTMKRPLVEGGVLSGLILNREAAAKLALAPNGGARAQSYSFRPICRMSNTYIAPGDFTFEELMEDVKHGFYLRGTRGGQVDPAVGSFQFNAEDAFLIENGETTKPILDVSLSGMILETLKNIDAVGKDQCLHVGRCGKEDQVVPVMDGAPHIRIRNAVVGGMG